MAANPTIQGYAPGTFLTAKAGAATIAVGTLVYVKSFTPANKVATVEQMLANSAPTLTKLYGIVVANLASTSSTVPIGGACLVQLAGPVNRAYSGLSPLPAVDDPLYVSNAGLVAVAPGSTSKVIGRVAHVTGSDVYLIMDGGFSGGGGGGGSATAQVLLAAPDGDFPTGVDISALTATQDFVDSVGVLGGTTGAPVGVVFDDGAAGSNGDGVFVPFSVPNSAGTRTMLGGLGLEYVDATATSEISALVAALVYLGSIEYVLSLEYNKLTFVNPDTGQPFTVYADRLLLDSATYARLKSAISIDAYIGSTPVWRAASEDFTQPSNMATLTWEPRAPRRRALTTTDATQTVIDQWQISGVATGGLLFLDVTTRVMGSSVAGTNAICAERRARFLFVESGGTVSLLSGPYVPVPDDGVSTGTPPDVTLDATGAFVRVLVTGVAATTMKWTSHTSIELHEVV